MSIPTKGSLIAVVTGLLVLLFAPAVRAQALAPQAPGTASLAPSGVQPPVMDNQIFAHLRFDQLEGRTNGSANEFRWDGEGWLGTDMNRLWFKSEGFRENHAFSDGDHEALYDRPIPHLRYFDAQAGVRADLDSEPGRAWAALGIEGLAPYFFEFAPTLYIRNGGHVAGRITGSYDLLLTQRWIVQPEAEFNFYSKDDPARKTGAGLSELDAGVRLRYELSWKFGPYVGFAYNGKYGRTASYTRQSGQTTSDPWFVFGIRAWY
ncbi:MAG TPA: copper resistance protein B [Acidobacteriaceae bacterium]|nr:copper resistance protein B [Acidobacteriaceae bacterium]